MSNRNGGNGANLGFEDKLWQAADKLRGHMDAAEYKHVVLGLIFLKYISDAFEERYQQLQFEFSDPAHENFIREEPMRYVALEDRDEYAAANVFWVPPEARWATLRGFARSPEIGQKIDNAMHAVEKENPKLRGVLSKDYARPTLDKRMLGELIDLIGTIGLGDADSRSKDVLGRVYEYFLGSLRWQKGARAASFIPRRRW